MSKRYEVAEHELPTSKRCTKCNVTKERVAFIRSNVHRDGLYPWCTVCRQAYRSRPDTLAASATRRRRWRQNNPGQQLLDNRKYIPKWRAENPEAAYKIARRAKEARRARLANVENTLTAQDWRDILQTFNHACAYCLRQDVPLEQEHMQPIVAGGGHTKENVIPACRSCNAVKGGRTLLEFASLSFGAALAA
jgi:5-methylcytosine-specific restriction endonuclease McrA